MWKSRFQIKIPFDCLRARILHIFSFHSFSIVDFEVRSHRQRLCHTHRHNSTKIEKANQSTSASRSIEQTETSSIRLHSKSVGKWVFQFCQLSYCAHSLSFFLSFSIEKEHLRAYEWNCSCARNSPALMMLHFDEEQNLLIRKYRLVVFGQQFIWM